MKTSMWSMVVMLALGAGALSCQVEATPETRAENLAVSSAAAQQPIQREKITISSLESQIVVQAQFNPKELTIEKSVPWQKQPNSESDAPALEFTTADGRTMSFDLFFDTFENGGDVHKTFVVPLEALASIDAELKRPPTVKVVWGSGLPVFKGVLESVSTKYTMFSPDGVPARATCNVRVREADEARARAEHCSDDSQCTAGQKCTAGLCQ